VIGGVFGLGLTWLGLVAVRHLPSKASALAKLDTSMLLATLALAVASSLLAGILPAWRGCRVSPAHQLKLN
jgi:putative ABC transport system permease protein